jgi:hypothetical protein
MGIYIVVIEQSTFRARTSSAPPSNVWLRNLAPSVHGLLLAERRTIYGLFCGLQGDPLSTLRISCMCTLILDQKRVLYRFN